MTKYIFSSVTNLFAEDISDNFIVLAMFAGKETIDEGPAFNKSIQKDATFLKIKEKITKNEKWWYAIDSKSILSNDNDQITTFSFKNANELYENKVKKLRAKSIKNCAEVLQNRRDIKTQIIDLIEKINDLIVEKRSLEENEKELNKNENNLEEILNKKKDFEEKIKNVDKNKAQHLMKIQKEELTNNLKETKIKKAIKQLEESPKKTTHCDKCKKNCHLNVDCWFNNTFFERCKVYFSVFDKTCEICGCLKKFHKQDNYYYHYIEVEVTVDKIDKKPEKKIEEVKDIENNEIEYKEIENIYKKLEKKKKELNEKKESIKNNIEIKNKFIYYNIVSIIKLTDKLNEIAMNNNHYEKKKNIYVI